MALILAAVPARGQDGYGARGIYPVYETGGQWVVFDKEAGRKKPSPLEAGTRFLVIGSRGSQLFMVARTSGTYGGACRQGKPLKLRAALLRGPRSAVGRPIIGIGVPADFNIKASNDRYIRLSNEVSEETYAELSAAIRRSAVEDMKAGTFRPRADDEGAQAFLGAPDPAKLQIKIDFGSRIPLQGAKRPFVFVEETQISASSRRCLRLADAGKLLGACVEMPRALMAETALLDFVAFDPSARGSPYLLAFTRVEPLWGDERWGFVIQAGGPRAFLADAMDIRCREGF